MEHLLADIYIPFDCEFLVARENPKGGVSLFEVYRVNRTATLHSRLLADGSQPLSLSWDNRSLYERRNDLFGATIRATSSQVMVLLIIIIIIIFTCSSSNNRTHATRGSYSLHRYWCLHLFPIRTQLRLTTRTARPVRAPRNLNIHCVHLRRQKYLTLSIPPPQPVKLGAWRWSLQFKPLSGL